MVRERAGTENATSFSRLSMRKIREVQVKSVPSPSSPRKRGTQGKLGSRCIGQDGGRSDGLSAVNIAQKNRADDDANPILGYLEKERLCGPRDAWETAESEVGETSSDRRREGWGPRVRKCHGTDLDERIRDGLCLAFDSSFHDDMQLGSEHIATLDIPIALEHGTTTPGEGLVNAL